MMSSVLTRPALVGLVGLGLKKWSSLVSHTRDALRRPDPNVEGLTGVPFILKIALERTDNTFFFEAMPIKIQVGRALVRGRPPFTLDSIPVTTPIVFSLTDEFHHSQGTFQCSAGALRFAHQCPYFGAYGTWVIGDRPVRHAPFTAAPGCVWKH